jgi:multidrug resistance efflux pump
MVEKIIRKIYHHKFLSIIIILLVVAGCFFGYRVLSGNKNTTQYALAQVKKDTLIVSVSGSGQVLALDQIDIKPKVSGDLVYLNIKKGQEIKKGAFLAQIDAKNYKQAVNEAEIALETAKLNLEDLLSPSGQSLLQAQNAYDQAELDYSKAKKDYENIETETVKNLNDAYENGYNNISTTFFNLSGYIKDLQDIMGTKNSEEEYLGSYKLILGENSPFISRFVGDYNLASDLYSKNFIFFREVFNDSSQDTIYKLISNTLKTTKAISSALESARHMYDTDAISNASSSYSISSVITKMKPKVESDLSSVFSDINSLQKNIDTIDNTVKDNPNTIIDSKIALSLAEEKMREKEKALQDLKNGVNSVDVRTQQNIVAQKENALALAKENLSNCYIYAPFNGVVSEIGVEKGDSISSGTLIASVVTKEKVVEISLNEVDAAKIKEGQRVILSFDALSDFSVSGKVAGVDTVGTLSQGVVSYGIKIIPDTQSDLIKPGYSVAGDIITNSSQNVLIVPNGAVKLQNGSHYVQTVVVSDSIKQNLSGNISASLLSSSPKSQEVTIGISNDLYTEITSGLNEGDIVISSTTNSNVPKTTTSSNSNNIFQTQRGFRQ